jgi:hypothetical protein
MPITPKTGSLFHAYSHYTAQTGKRIQAVLNGAPPASCARSTAPLIAEGLSGKY